MYTPRVNYCIMYQDFFGFAFRSRLHAHRANLRETIQPYTRRSSALWANGASRCRDPVRLQHRACPCSADGTALRAGHDRVRASSAGADMAALDEGMIHRRVHANDANFGSHVTTAAAAAFGHRRVGCLAVIGILCIIRVCQAHSMHHRRRRHLLCARQLALLEITAVAAMYAVPVRRRGE